MDIDTKVTIKTTQQLFSNYKIPVQKTRATEYGELQNYFMSLNLKDRNNRLLPRSVIGFYLKPFHKDKNYGLLYDLKMKCERSSNPSACFWSCVKPK